MIKLRNSSNRKSTQPTYVQIDGFASAPAVEPEVEVAKAAPATGQVEVAKAAPAVEPQVWPAEQTEPQVEVAKAAPAVEPQVAVAQAELQAQATGLRSLGHFVPKDTGQNDEGRLHPYTEADMLEAQQQTPGTAIDSTPTTCPTNGTAPAGQSTQQTATTSSAEAAFATTQAAAEPEEELIRKRRRKSYSARKRRLRIAAVVVAVLVCVGAGSAFAINSMVNSGRQNLVAEAQDIQTEASAVTYDEGRTVTYGGHTYQLNENMTSICLIGYDQDTDDAAAQVTGQADAIMVAAVDTSTGKVTVICIPRNSMVDVGLYAGSAFITEERMQLCLAFSYGDDSAAGSQYTTNIAQRVLYNMPISYYYTLNIYGIGPMANAIGGVQLTALDTIPGTDITAGQDTLLLGNNAYKYVQWRDTKDFDSPLDRQARQVQFVKEYARQVTAGGQANMSTLLELFNTASEYSTTNLGLSEFSYLASCVLGSGITDLEVISLDGEVQDNGQLMEYELDRTSVYQTVLDVYYTQVD